MAQDNPAAVGTKPLWRRIVDFPLVAMIIALGLLAMALSASKFAGDLLPPMHKDLELIARAVIAIGLVFAAYKFVMRDLGEEPHDDLKLVDAPKGLGVGLLLGFLIFTAVVGVAAVVDVYNIVGEGGTGELVALLVGTAILPGFMEELAFRGILFRWIEQFGGSWLALAVTSALFGFAHAGNPGATASSTIFIAVEAGVLLGALYMLTRSLWAPIGLHAAWNFTQGFIFDVPVSGHDQEGLVEARLSGPELLSGGAFGLEASIIAMVIATAVGVWLLILAIRQGQLVSPWWVMRRRAPAAPVPARPATGGD